MADAPASAAATADNRAATELPAVYVNHVQFTVLSNSLARLSFGEVIPPNPPVYRYTVLMPLEDARQFAQGILNAFGSAAKPTS